MKANTKTVALSGEVSKAVAAMIAAVVEEAGVRSNVETMLAKATASAWSVCRDTLKGVLMAKPAKVKKGDDAPASPVKNAELLLSAFRSAVDETAKTTPLAKRGKQYASDLARAVNAVKAGKTIPADVWTMARGPWTDAEFWREAGVIKATGKATHKAKPNAGKAASEGEEGGESVAEAADKPLSDLMGIVAHLHGPFRAEWMEAATAEAQRILKKQAQATGTGQGERIAA